ncbi:hypothetical protein [Crocinitomix catalasitica]|uniref:hypothetical protein n=1 Tax=Crocinitomix catalasitica TaxID=184607 RepID=UPI0004865590|nr:hypothetical protein [Crocinitomix catalasitica]
MSNTISNNDSFFNKYESQRYGIMSILLLIVGCSAGIAVGLGALTQVFSLIILSMTTMAALSMMIALAPLKYIFITSGLAIFVDMIIILINLI